jgi:protein involved in polysaccharide export with SLBB domain
MALLALARPTGLGAQVSRLDSLPATLAPGDMVRIAVWRRPELSGDFIVAPDSSITHPLMREVKVAGVPFGTVENRVHAFLLKFDANPAFVISPLLRVFIGGEVRAPNVYSVPPGTTVAQAIGLAGGPTDRAELERVILERRQSRTVLDLAAESPSAMVEVRSGDQVLISRRRSVFTDIVAPAASVIGAAAAIVSVIVQLRR